ncbi:MAG TPA: hypothetical protein VG944_14585 [Fimbriimonas sp.]|nr:hypothetical protein [Fimbriimonas sp.]
MLNPNSKAPINDESWMRMVLKAMPTPAWLSADAPNGDVVLSSRVRIMRNLQGYRFVHLATEKELQQIMARVVEAAVDAALDLEAFKSLTNAERDYLLGCRLVSPDFEWTLPGRALLIDRTRSLCVMVNEEDHLRVQALTPGLSIPYANSVATRALAALEVRVPFAHSPAYGYLSASYINLGEGKRMSAMFHLIGLAQAKRLPSVIEALSARNITVRGLFGESSRAVGAFAQVSVISGVHEDFAGACDYLLQEERRARRTVSADKLLEKANQAREFALSSRLVSLADALRVLAWIRWAACAEQPGFHVKTRDIDAALTVLEIRGSRREEAAARQRAQFLRSIVSA